MTQDLHGRYIGRKCFASINVQGTCDASDQFTSTSAESAEWPGSVHDVRCPGEEVEREEIERERETFCHGTKGPCAF